jgi:hypothetical protein
MHTAEFVKRIFILIEAEPILHDTTKKVTFWERLK